VREGSTGDVAVQDAAVRDGAAAADT